MLKHKRFSILFIKYVSLLFKKKLVIIVIKKEIIIVHSDLGTMANTRLRGVAMREREREGRRSGTVENVRVSRRLDGLHLLHHRDGNRTDTESHCEGLLRLLGIQDCGISSLAS